MVIGMRLHQPPRFEPARVEPPRLEPPRLKPPRLEPPRLEPLRLEPLRIEPPRPEPPAWSRRVNPRVEATVGIGRPGALSRAPYSLRNNFRLGTAQAFQDKLICELFFFGTGQLELGKISRPVSPFPHSILKKLILDMHIVVLEQHERCIQV